VQQKQERPVNKARTTLSTLRTLVVTGFAALSCAAALPTHAAKFAIVNGDEPNVGLNDTTPVAPVGGNSGTTLGQQRLIAMNFVAAIWGRTLSGTDQTFEVLTNFAPSDCNDFSGVLASAGPYTVFSDFDNAKFPSTWYPGALANRLAGRDLDTDTNEAFPELAVSTNVNVGTDGCLSSGGWYYGLDGNVPEGKFDFIRVILHEFGHGVGFLSLANASTGELLENVPSVWEHFLLDGVTNKRWVDMTDAERKASAVNNQNLSWAGPKAFFAAKKTLTKESQVDVFIGEPSIGEFFAAGIANYGPGDGRRSASGRFAYISEPRRECASFTPDQARRLKGRIALITSPDCGFIIETINAQAAGAVAVVFDSANPEFGGRPRFGFDFGIETPITIPSVFISMQDGAKIRALPSGSVFAAIIERRRNAGVDRFGRPLMFAPTTVNAGSSVSHFDVTASPNLLMEPFAIGDESITLKPPTDLTLPLLQDIGW
jgi:hypothetical protein